MLISNNNETLMDVCGQRQVFGFKNPAHVVFNSRGVTAWLVSMKRCSNNNIWLQKASVLFDGHSKTSV